MRIFTLMLLLFAGAAVSRAETNLARINRLVETETAHLQEIQHREKELSSTLDKYETLIAELRNQEAQAAAALREAETAREGAAQELAATEERAEHLNGIARTRLRVLYMRGQETAFTRLAHLGNGGDFARNAFFLARIRAGDTQLLRTLDASRRELHGKRQNLDAFRTKNLELKKRISRNRTDMEKELESRKLILEEIRQQQELSRKALENLRKQAEELEVVVSSLTGGVRPVETEPEPAPRPFTGKGLEKDRGKLPSPVKGKVVRKFGKQRVAEFKDIVMAKGIEYAVQEPEVRAIAEGKVIYTGRMPGYGTVLILDHGQRYYSLYGRLAELQVTNDAVLERGQVFAKVDANEKNPGNFYFEIRRNGSPVNPQIYLKK